MSYFTSLSPTSQNILMIQFEFFGKIFIFGFFFLLAILYLFYWKKIQKDTPYKLVGLIRTWIYFLSWIYIYFTPLFIVWLYPQQSIDRVLGGMFLFYRYATLLIGLTLFFNILFYGPMIIAKLGGVDIKSRNTNKILDQLLGKYKSLFKRT